MELRSIVDDLKVKLEEIEKREERTVNEIADFLRREEQIVNKKTKYAKDRIYLDTEQKAINEKKLKCQKSKQKDA